MYTEKDIKRYKQQLDFANKMEDIIKVSYLEKKILEAETCLAEINRRELEKKHQEEIEATEEKNRLKRIQAHSWVYQRAQLVKVGITPIWYTYKVTFYSETNLDQIKELYQKLKSDIGTMNPYTGTYSGITFESIINHYNLDKEEINDAGYIDQIEDFACGDTILTDESKQKMLIESITKGIPLEGMKYFSNGFDGNQFYTIQKVIEESFLELWDAFLAQEFPGIKYKYDFITK